MSITFKNQLTSDNPLLCNLPILLSPQMGAKELEANAISHLEEVSDNGIAAMAEAGTVAVILPTTAYILRLPQPPVRKMIEAGVIVALGTDFNPNAFCLSMVLKSYLFLNLELLT